MPTHLEVTTWTSQRMTTNFEKFELLTFRKLMRSNQILEVWMADFITKKSRPSN